MTGGINLPRSRYLVAIFGEYFDGTRFIAVVRRFELDLGRDVSRRRMLCIRQAPTSSSKPLYGAPDSVLTTHRKLENYLFGVKLSILRNYSVIGLDMTSYCNEN